MCLKLASGLFEDNFWSENNLQGMEVLEEFDCDIRCKNEIAYGLHWGNPPAWELIYIIAPFGTLAH